MRFVGGCSILATTLLVLAMFKPATAQFKATSISIGGVSQDVNPNRIPRFVNLSPDENGNFPVVVRLENAGEGELIIEEVDIRVLEGIFFNSTELDDTATAIDIDAENLNSFAPVPEGESLSNGLKFAIKSGSIKESSTCSDTDVTLEITLQVSSGTEAVQEVVIFLPAVVIPKCLTSTVSASGEQLPVKVEFAYPYVETNRDELPFLIDFGQKVLELNPLKLFNVTGSNRTDVVYDVENGRVFLMVYPEDDLKKSLIRVDVPAGVTESSGSRIPNGGGSAYAQFQPKSGAIHVAALVMTGVFAGTVLAAWLTSFIVSSMQPWATAGSLGYGTLAIILWAQKMYFTGLFDFSTMPANYKTLSDTFAWASFQAELPWQWANEKFPGGVSRNLTSPGVIFETNAMVILGSDSGEFKSYYSSISGGIPDETPPPSEQAPPLGNGNSPGAGSIPPPTNPTQTNRTTPSPEEDSENLSINPGTISNPDSSIPDSCTVLQNVDLFGGDLAGTQPFLTTDPQTCCNACLANPNCFTWTLSLIDSLCYLKGSEGWLVRGSTCCLSGSANRGGNPFVIPMPPPPPPPPPPPSPPPPPPSPPLPPTRESDGNSAEEDASGNNNANSDGNNNRRLLVEKRNYDSNFSVGRSLLQMPIYNNTNIAIDNVRYILVSTGSSLDFREEPTVIKESDAGGKALYIINSAESRDALTPKGESDNVYNRLERVGFWFGVVFLAACIFNVAGWFLVRCCEGEVPGVLHVPRMILMIIMMVLCTLSFGSTRLLKDANDVVQISVGVAVILCGPVLFLFASYIGITAALYRKKKAIYLLSSRAASENHGEFSKWERKIVGSLMGMSLNRGKWRPADPSRKNEFVFRWGPIFEDCRGPLYQRRKSHTDSNANGMRQLSSAASDHSSRIDAGADYSVFSGSTHRSSTSRRRTSPVEEKSFMKLCGRKLRRSSFQAFGVIVSLARMCGYMAIIGGLGKWPIAQTSALLGISILYCGYLRFTVPYSRRDEMALEYWTSFLDVAIFALFLYLSLGVDDTDFSKIDTMGYILIAFQSLIFLSYLANRGLIIYHAFAEIICPAFTLPNSPKKRKRRSGRSRASMSRNGSVSMSISEASINPQFSASKKDYFEAKDSFSMADSESVSHGNGKIFSPPHMDPMVSSYEQSVPGQLDNPNRASKARPGMFPAIMEEQENTSETLAANAILPDVLPLPPKDSGPKAMPIANLEEEEEKDKSSPESVFNRFAPNNMRGIGNNKDNDVFDRFWKSL